jgi:hypothetical protein
MTFLLFFFTELIYYSSQEQCQFIMPVFNSAQKRREKSHPWQNFLKDYFVISPPANILILHQLSYYIFYYKSKRKMQLEKITDIFRVVKGSEHCLLPSSIAVHQLSSLLP